LNGRLVTEIVTLRSLQYLQARLESENESYLSQKEEISERNTATRTGSSSSTSRSSAEKRTVRRRKDPIGSSSRD
jgi:hypothetical protein